MGYLRALGFFITVVMTGLYLGALCAGTQYGIQLTHMMGVKDVALGPVYQWFYTMLLCGTVVLFLIAEFSRRVLGVCLISVAGAGIALTALPLVYSLLHSFNSGFYEYYVGEIITIVGLALLIIGVSSHVKIATVSPQSGCGTTEAAPLAVSGRSHVGGSAGEKGRQMRGMPFSLLYGDRERVA